MLTLGQDDVPYSGIMTFIIKFHLLSKLKWFISSSLEWRIFARGKSSTLFAGLS